MIKNIKKYLKDSASELKKVSWPTKKETLENSTFVIIISIVLSLYIAGVDWIFKSIIANLVLK